MTSPSAGPGVSAWQRRGQQVWSSFVNLLLPPKCGGCQQPGSLWCESCRAAATPIAPPWCEKCGEPSVADRLCVNCRSHPLTIEKIRSVALFQGPVRQGIHRFKYQHWSGLADPFGEMLAAYWVAQQLTADWVIPVPLHPARERERGYNQSELLARQLSVRVNMPLAARGLRRTRVTAVQMTLSAAQRRENVAGAFECVEPRVRGARVIVIDDVCTTGSTLEACAEALFKAGAASVMGLTLARTSWGADPQTQGVQT